MEYTLDGATFGSVPTGLTLTGVTLYDFTALGSANLGRANLPTILLYGDQGTQFLGTANYASTGEPVKVRQADGTEVEMTPVTYTFTDPIAADTGDYRLVLNAVLPPTLPLFSNSLVDGSVMYGTEGSVAPYITFLGKTSPTVYTHTLAGNESLSSIWKSYGLSDSANCHLIVQVNADQTLTLDQSLENATLIIEARGAGASDPTQQHAAPAVVFAEGARMTGPFVFRNASGVTNGMISVSGPWQDSDKNDNDQLWEPDSLAIDCDLAFTSPLPLRPRGWFQENDVRVRAGRTLRLESKASNEARLPSVDLTAPSATLTLADTDQTGTIPSKYAEYFFTETSGTLVFAREVALALTSTSSSAEQDSQGAIYRIGNKGDKAYNFNLVIDGYDFSTRDRIRLGGPSGRTTLEIRQTMMGPAPTVTFQDLQFVGNATLLQRLGTLTLGSNQWTTKFVVGEGDSTLLIGDGEGTSRSATTDIYGIPYGESGTGERHTDYRGAGDILVNADGILNLHPTADPLKGTDYHLYPAERRSLTLRNGGVLNAVDGAVTVDFESPDTLAAPMAVATIPGLTVENAATLSADPGASLAIDSLKGTGTITIGGTVTIDTVKSLPGTTLTLDGDPARANYDELSGTIGAVSGTGTVLFGDLGAGSATATDTVQRIADTLEVGGFTGSVGFLVGNLNGAATERDFPTVDFAATDVPHLPYTLAVQPNQTLVMRLDQYVDADILWPEDCSNVKLVLVEAGPFGGEATLPAWPKDVIFEFHRYDTGSDKIPGSASTHSPIAKPNYNVSFDVNQGTVDLTWKDPVLTGKVAWIDMEFNGDSRNSGWYRLGDDDHNGMLSGWSDAESQGAGELITRGSAFKTTHNPQSEGLDNTYKAYLSDKTFRLPEEQWSIVARIQAPLGSGVVDVALHGNRTILAIGSNYQSGSTDGVLVLATGSLKNDRLDTDLDTRTDELILWFVPNNTNADDMVKLATATIPTVGDSLHLYTITYDRGTVTIWLDETQLMRSVLPPNTKIGKGLQIGQMMGGTNRNSAIVEKVQDINDNWLFDGCFDFLRIYRGLITDSARLSLVHQYPYIHKQIESSDYIRDVRYVRELDGGDDNLWVDEANKPWQRQYARSSNVWLNAGKYAEPAEGAIVIIKCSAQSTILVNTTKHDQFPSANRTYAQLIVKGGGTLGNRYGKLTIKPCEDWKTATTTDGEYTYGRIAFSGGAGDKIAQYESNGDDEDGAGTDAVYTWNDATFYASVVDFARAGFSFKEERSVEMRVDTETEGSTFFRGVEEELMFVRQLTGTVSGTGHFVKNTDAIEAAYGQNSEFVWVPGYNGLNPWKVDDVTREYNDTNGDGTCDGTEIIDKGNNVLLPQEGLFVRCMKVPGTLYLEQHVDSEVPENGALSKQKWYRYGYHGDTAAESPWNLAPEEAKEGDFEKAVVLKIRLKDGQTKTLRVDQATTLQELIVEEPAEKYNPTDADEGLVLLPAANGTRLTVTDAVTTARPLNVYDASAFSTETGGTGADAILLRPKTEEVVDVATGESTTVVTGGTLLHGVNLGAYAAGNSTINHPLDGSSIARIESVNAIAFTAAQNLPATTVAAAENATVSQTGAENAFRAKAMELAKDSRFTFASSAATVDEGITLTGNATLEGSGTKARLTPIAGIAGQAGLETTPTLTLDAAEGASWKLLNSEVGGLPLTKVGAGTADIATDLPPNAGKVDVREGTLAVATGLAGEHQAVGQKGLNVEAGATLDATASTIDTDVLAEIPAKQTVSGLGSIAGQLRLNKGALLDATEAFADGDALHTLTVDTLTTDGATALADIDVALPESTQSGLVFLRSNETTLNWDARARLLAKANGTRWDVFLKYRPDQTTAVGTNYLVDVAGLDVPTFPPDEEQPGEGENEWPDEDGDGSDTGDELGDQIQNGGNIAGEAEGYTKANTQWLMAPDIANAYACFGNVWTLAPRALSADSEDYATRDLLMAYEFGISRMAFTQDNAYIVIEATLRNALADCTYFEKTLLQGADKLKPVFLTGVTVAIVGKDGTPLADVQEINASTAASHGFTPIETATETARWFLVPYNKDNFPEGTATNLTVRALPPAKQTATPEN